MRRQWNAAVTLSFVIGLWTVLASDPATGSSRELRPSSYEKRLSSYDDDEYGDLHAVVVRKDGDVVAERYFGEGSRARQVDVRSAGKSVTSLMVGIALDRGAIASLDDPVFTYWPESEGSAVGAVRLNELLTMRSGLNADGNDPESPGYEDYLDASENTLAFALSVPRLEEPGTQYRYNSVTAFVAGVVVARATGQRLGEFAKANLFEPLGFQSWEWQEDQSGVTKGQGNLFLTARDFAAIGQMVLDGGVFNDRQVVSSEWIKASLGPKVDISEYEPNAIGYGYYWFYQTYEVKDRTVEVWFASGNGGNKIYVVPAFDMVVAVMSTAYGQWRGQQRSEDILLALLEEEE